MAFITVRPDSVVRQMESAIRSASRKFIEEETEKAKQIIATRLTEVAAKLVVVYQEHKDYCYNVDINLVIKVPD